MKLLRGSLYHQRGAASNTTKLLHADRSGKKRAKAVSRVFEPTAFSLFFCGFFAFRRANEKPKRAFLPGGRCLEQYYTVRHIAYLDFVGPAPALHTFDVNWCITAAQHHWGKGGNHTSASARNKNREKRTEKLLEGSVFHTRKKKSQGTQSK